MAINSPFPIIFMQLVRPRYLAGLLTPWFPLLIGAIINHQACAQSFIVPDETLGVEQTQIIENVNDLPVEVITGGARRGQNLFHSFREFNVSTDRGAYFFNPDASIQNILGRVTGNSISTILGTLGTFGQGNPNLFLINPNGIVFGKNASLNVQGSFTATTASSVAFNSGGFFSAINPEAPSTLLTVNPSAFLFNAIAPPAQIINRSTASSTVLGGSTFGLQVPNGAILTLLGGDVTLEGGLIGVLDGRVEIGTVADAGSVAIDSNGYLQFPLELQRGNVTLTQESLLVSVPLDAGGEIVITASNIQLLDSRLIGGIFPDLSTEGSRAGDLTLDATGTIQVAQNSRIVNNVGFGSSGDSGNLNIQANHIILDNGIISSSVDGTGEGGNIRIIADFLTITNGAQLSASVSGRGNSGSILIDVENKISIDGADPVTGFSSSGISSSILPGGAGNGGDIAIRAGSLSVTNGGQLSALNSGLGDGGNILIDVLDEVSIDGADPINGSVSGILSIIQFNGLGNGGNIEINAGERLRISNGGVLSADAFGEGDGGNIVLNAFDSVILTGSNSSFSSAISTTTASRGSGGNIEVNTDYLNISDDAVLTATAISDGDGGNITVDVTRLDLLSGGSFRAQTISNGRSGKITINADEQIFISGRGMSGIPSNLTVRFTPDSVAGEIELNTGTLHLDEQGEITAVAPSGNGGNLTLNIQNLLLMRRGSRISVTAGTLEQNGNGGNILINVPFIVAIPAENSDIAADAFDGAGGKVTITAKGIFGIEPRPQRTALSDITASSELGVSGTVAIDTLDTSFIQNSLSQLRSDSIDTNELLAQTCIIRQDQPEGTFYITGTGGIPNRPNDPALSTYPTNTIQSTTQTADRPWKLGDPIVEPQGFYTLADGRFVMSRECDR
ncbi:filamentous hemagglutinin N-terminal domain-containing protein [Alkalinema pantanalense CENA528]|uniref:two-partner secretion domain-containing protein n=1 Tax=Alkalinema pantanalense TaxID=1620705 RepID=UPI003D6FB2FA